MIILSDFSQLAISAVAANPEVIKGDNTADLVKHIALVSILNLKQKFGGRLILCCDSRTYWRKEVFPLYKGHRKHHKDTGIDWDMVYSTINEMKAELSENFPYMVLEVPGAEADDIIATLVKYFSENELTQTGLIQAPNQIVIGSTDGDFKQLQKYKNVKQWGNVTKTFIECKNPREYLIEHIITGDAGDNIPSVVNGDAWAESRANNIPTRAKPLMKTRYQLFFEMGYDACQNEEEQRNYKRNEALIDLDLIPTNISDKIIKAYHEYEIKGNKPKIMAYLQQHRMKLLLQSIQQF